VEAPAPVSVLLAGLLLKMGGYGLIRYNLLLFPAADELLWPAFTAIGLITMVYGASVAFVAQDLKRMIALTSVNHMGYVLLGTFTLTSVGVSAAVFQMFAHGLAVGMLFLLMLSRVVMTPPVGTKNELGTGPLLILTAFLVPLLVFGVYPSPLLGSAIKPTVDHALSVLFPGGN